jgi:hypothetical protein
VPACGEFPSGSEASLRDTSRFVDSVLQHWSSEQSKVPVAIQLDGKSSESLTYGLLVFQSTKIYYHFIYSQTIEPFHEDSLFIVDQADGCYNKWCKGACSPVFAWRPCCPGLSKHGTISISIGILRLFDCRTSACSN